MNYGLQEGVVAKTCNCLVAWRFSGLSKKLGFYLLTIDLRPLKSILINLADQIFSLQF